MDVANDPCKRRENVYPNTTRTVNELETFAMARELSRKLIVKTHEENGGKSVI